MTIFTRSRSFVRYMTEGAFATWSGPSPRSDDPDKTSIAHIQGIARFPIGFGTEQDDKTRDYSLDLCSSRSAVYDSGGIPIEIFPIENSGYSLGSLQWDFGQGTALATRFTDSFLAWHSASPGSLSLASSREAAIKGFKGRRKHIPCPTHDRTASPGH